MKKFALMVATLICFAGCARNDPDDMTATDTTTTEDTGLGTAASSQSGTTDSSMDTNAWTDPSQREAMSDTDALRGSSTLDLDTNNLGQPAQPQPAPQSVPPTPPALDEQPQQEPQPQQDLQPTP